MFTHRSIMLKVFALASLLALTLSACGGGAVAPELGLVDQRGAVSVEVEVPVAESFVGAEGGAGFAGAPSFDAIAGGELATDRIVLKTADLSIVVDDPLERMDAIIQMAEDLGGFVVSSNVYMTQTTTGEEVPNATITFRVPSDRFAGALTQVEGGANQILTRNISGQDVTREYTDLQSRLRNLENAADQLREIMASATKTEEVLAVYNQLTYVTEQIEVTRGQIQYYKESSDFSAISVSLIPDAAVAPVSIAGWQPEGIAKDAVRALLGTLQSIANVAIWLALYVLPVALVIGLPTWGAWSAAKAVSRRRKMKMQPKAAE